MAEKHIVIIGGGIGGLTAAIALHKAGAKVAVYEQAPQLGEIGAGINVQGVAMGVLFNLGFNEADFMAHNMGDSIETTAMEYYSVKGTKIADEPVGRRLGDKYPQLSVHRAWFHNTLVAKAKEIGVPFHLDHVFLTFDKNADESINVHFEKMSTPGVRQPSIKCDFLIGADGLKSPVRATLMGEDVIPTYTGKVIYRGLTKIPSLISDGSTVCNAGNEKFNFIAYPVSDSMRLKGECYCNWGFAIERPHPGDAFEDWRMAVDLSDLADDLKRLDGVSYGGFTPFQIAAQTDKIIKWAMFDRDPLQSWDWGNVTLLGDAAHPLLPYGSQGATQAIMDAEALGVFYQQCVADGSGIKACVKRYSDYRCEPAGKVVLSNRNMGSTAVLRVAEAEIKDLSKEDQKKWAAANGQKLYDSVIKEYRKGLPKTASLIPASKL